MLEDLNKLAEYIEKLAQFTTELRIENRSLTEQISVQKSQQLSLTEQNQQLQDESNSLKSEIERLEKAYALVQNQLSETSKDNDKLRQGLTAAIEKIHSIVQVLPIAPLTTQKEPNADRNSTTNVTTYSIPSIAPNHANSKPTPQTEVVPLTGTASRWS